MLKAPTGSLPAVVGVDLGDQGYAIAKVLKVWGRDPVAADAARAQAQYAQSWADAEAQAYYAALKSRFNVEIIGAPAARREDGRKRPPSRSGAEPRSAAGPARAPKVPPLYSTALWWL